MGPLWSSTSSHNVGLSAATVHRATPPFNPQQGNDWETRSPNKCPFVIRAWKLWSQHKLILVSEVVQKITWILSRWVSLRRVMWRQGQIRKGFSFSSSACDDWRGRRALCIFTRIYLWKDYESSSHMWHCSCDISLYRNIVLQWQTRNQNIVNQCIKYIWAFNWFIIKLFY